MAAPKTKRTEKPRGKMRMSSAMLGAGPGAMLDLPDAAVLVAGLDHWGNPLKPGLSASRFVEVPDARLQEYVRRSLDAPGPVRLFHVYPAETEAGAAPEQGGLRAWEFPEWYVTRDAVDPARSSARVRSRYLLRREALNGKGELELDDDSGASKKRSRTVPVVPVRFVRACPRGHVEDLDWVGYAHPNHPRCKAILPLRLEERGTSGDIAELFVVCTACKTEQSMVRATIYDRATGLGALGRCRGVSLWSGSTRTSECKNERGQPTPARLLIRSATNAWFPAQLSAITLPTAEATRSPLRRILDVLWNKGLKGVTNAMFLGFVMQSNDEIRDALAGYAEAEVLAEIERKRADEAAEASLTPEEDDKRTRGPKAPELDTFFAVDNLAGVDEPGSHFFAQRIAAPARKSLKARRYIDRVVQVHRLREVRALVGFTRFEAPVTNQAGDLDLEIGVHPAPLASHKQWVPAVENHGEGVFFALDGEHVRDWASERAVRDREDQLRRGFDRWVAERGAKGAYFYGAPFVMLHSLSHLLTTAMSLECGYPSSSIRERVYALGDRYGVLLYTSSPDAEGTLGGLVATGRELERHIDNALELARLCSNDPVCAHYAPDNASGELTLQGAACHGCLLISETSCERQNTWLDRALVVPTLTHRDTAFFRDW